MSPTRLYERISLIHIDECSLTNTAQLILSEPPVRGKPDFEADRPTMSYFNDHPSRKANVK